MSKTQAILRLHANEKIAHALHSIQPLLDHHKLQWHDHGRNPDCQFTSFIHALQKTIPALEKIIEVRRACRNWLISNPPPGVESGSAWRDKILPFGYGTDLRKQGNDHSLRGLAGAFKTRINVIVITTSEHHIQQFNPPENTQHLQEVWLIYMNLENISHYLSTIPAMDPTIPPPPPPSITRAASRTSARARRVPGSTEPTNDPALAVGSSSRVAVQVPALPSPNASQGASQDSQPTSVPEDIFANIQYVEGDFVHGLIQQGALNFIQRI